MDRPSSTEKVYEGDAGTDSNSLEVIVARLRRKIGKDMIQTERGRGYKLTAARDDARCASLSRRSGHRRRRLSIAAGAGDRRAIIFFVLHRFVQGQIDQRLDTQILFLSSMCTRTADGTLTLQACRRARRSIALAAVGIGRSGTEEYVCGPFAWRRARRAGLERLSVRHRRDHVQTRRSRRSSATERNDRGLPTVRVPTIERCISVSRRSRSPESRPSIARFCATRGGGGPLRKRRQRLRLGLRPGVALVVAMPDLVAAPRAAPARTVAAVGRRRARWPQQAAPSSTVIEIQPLARSSCAAAQKQCSAGNVHGAMSQPGARIEDAVATLASHCETTVPERRNWRTPSK